MTLAKPLLIARRSSHMSRVALMFAAEFNQAIDVRPLSNLMSLHSADYGGNPALKIPVMQYGRERWFGALNIARKLWQISGGTRRVLWPEQLTAPVLSNALELTLNGMGCEVTLIMDRVATNGAIVGEPPAVLSKTRASLEGSVAWLERKLPQVTGALPPSRELSYLEVCLFCFAEHLEWRDVLSLGPYPQLRAFRDSYGKRASALATAYRFDE